MVTVQGGQARVSELSKRRRICQDPRTASIWSHEDEEGFKVAVDECRAGTVWWLSKHGRPSSEGED
jgi:hypothetical protein